MLKSKFWCVLGKPNTAFELEARQTSAALDVSNDLSFCLSTQTSKMYKVILCDILAGFLLWTIALGYARTSYWSWAVKGWVITAIQIVSS